MPELVNDQQRPLSKPCETGFLGGMICTRTDYQSWRRVAVALRETMLAGQYGDDQDLYERVLSWLGKWANTDDLSVGEHVEAFKESRTEADPDLPDDATRFPRKLSLFQGQITALYQRTMELVNYIRDGQGLYREAVSRGAVEKIAGELAQAEKRDRPPWSVPGWVGPVAILGLVAAGATWIYTSILKAKRGPQTWRE